MTWSQASWLLIGHLVVLSLVSFGGVPAALPDLRDFVVGQGWMTARDFANCFAIVQAIPGPNMILLTSFVGWQVGGLPVAIAAGVATFGPSCALAFIAFRFWDRFRGRHWQTVARLGLAPVTIGLVMAGGFVMGRGGDAGWMSLGIAVAAGAMTLANRFSPLWLLGIAAALGACGLI